MIITILLIVFILVLLLILKNRESFSLLMFPKTYYLTKPESCKLLNSVTELNQYNDMDFKLRKIDKNKYRNNVANHYCNRIEDFNNYDKHMLNWVMDSLQKTTPKNLKFIYKKIQFAKYSENTENDFPHTHKNTIFLSKVYINSIIPYFNRKNIEDMLRDIGVVIIHECVHIWQRNNKSLFYKLYIYYWNFIKVDKIYNNKYKDMVRFNPDGTDINWVFSMNNKYIVPLSLYRENSNSIGNVRNVGIFLDKNGVSFSIPNNESDLVIKNLNDIPGFSGFFNDITGNNYHPNELSAELISIYYMKQIGISHRDFNNKALDKLNIWFNKDVYPKYYLE
jgi:hypothetical protein